MPDTLTDNQHDWLSSFTGIATRIGGAVAAAASGVASTVGQAVGAAGVAASAPPPADTAPTMPVQTPPAPAPTPPVVPAPSPAPAASAGSGPAITVAPAPFEADTVTDFLAKGHARFGGKSMGYTDWQTPPPKWNTDKDGKLTTLDFTLTITVSYATFGGGSPDANNEKAIKDVAARTKAHEERHQRDIEAAWKAWDPAKVRSDLMARTFKTAKEVTDAISAEVTKLKTAVKAACLKLHGAEGVVSATPNADGTFTVTETAEGASGCK